MNIYEATVFKVRFQDGVIAQVEDHENYSLLTTDDQGAVVGWYYFVENKPTTMYFCMRDEKGDECLYTLEVIAYMFGYSGEWIEV